MKAKDKNRIYHPWEKWEDFKYNFYNSCTGKTREGKVKSTLKMFNSEPETLRCMEYVVNNWTHSMEHNLTNPNMNKIAYIGQCACAYYDKIPNIVTMSAWCDLSDTVRDRADEQAKKQLLLWERKHKSKITLANGKAKDTPTGYQTKLPLN